MKCSTCGAKIHLEKMKHDKGHCIKFLLEKIEMMEKENTSKVCQHSDTLNPAPEGKLPIPLQNELINSRN